MEGPYNRRLKTEFSQGESGVAMEIAMGVAMEIAMLKMPVNEFTHTDMVAWHR